LTVTLIGPGNKYGIGYAQADMAKHLLSDRHLRNAKPKDKPYQRYDGQGLALLVSPTGVKSWQQRYKLGGKQQTLTLGKFDRLSLAEARVKAQEQRKLAA
jgi:integrase